MTSSHSHQQGMNSSPVAAPGAGPNSGSTPTLMGGANAPCSTLFVANLGQFVDEQELKELFGSFPGYCRLRMHNKGGAPVAFVEYADVRFAAQALMALQGTYLLSSDRGGVRIEYARNKMAEAGNSPTSGQGPTDKLIHAAAAEMEAKMSQSNNHLAAAAAANSALSQAVQGAPLHALGLYGHHIWLGMQD